MRVVEHEHNGGAADHSRFVDFLSDQGWIGQGILAKDWSQTSIGSIEKWPEALRATLRMVLTTRQSINFFWGPDLHQFFNEAYAPTLDGMPPEPIGAPFTDYWAEAFEGVRPYFERAMRGEGTWEENLPLLLTRKGVTEQTYWTFSYSPLYDGEGQIAGFLNVVNETTKAVRTRQALEAAQQQLANEREQLAAMFEQAPTFMAVLNGSEHRVMMTNPEYMKLVGHRPVVGQRFAEALPDAVEQGYMKLLDEAFESGRAFTATGAEYLMRAEAGGPVRQRFVDVVFQPLRGPDTQVTGIFVEGSDVTERVQAEAALRESEEHMRLILEAARDHAIITIDPTHLIVGWSRGAEEIFGEKAEEVIGTSSDRLFTPQDRSEGVPAQELETAERDGVAADVRWHQRLDGARVFMAGTVRPLPRGKDGQAKGFIKIARNATAEKLAADRQAALLELGDRLRDTTTVADVVGVAAEVLGRTLNASRAGYASINVRAGTFTIMNDWTLPDVESLAGEHPLSMFPATVGRAVQGNDMVAADIAAVDWLSQDQRSYSAIGVHSRIKVPLVARGQLKGWLFVHNANPRNWTKDEVDFAHGVADRTYAALGKLEAEAEQELLNNELSHRLKNMMTLVQAIAGQTLRDVADRESVQAFIQRLHALSSAHDVLLRQSWQAAPMMSVVTSVLVAFGPFDRFDVGGPVVTLGPRSTLSLSLLLHELATNALKYGSLSNETGRVSLEWAVEDDDEPTLVLQWRETGGPGAQEPKRRGFGSRLIRSGLVGTGGVELRYAPTGFEADMTAPLEHVQAS